MMSALKDIISELGQLVSQAARASDLEDKLIGTAEELIRLRARHAEYKHCMAVDHGVIADQRAEIEALKAAHEPKPMDKAPKDGSWVYLMTKARAHPRGILWIRSDGEFCLGYCGWSNYTPNPEDKETK